jgi:hypothetical protein
MRSISFVATVVLCFVLVANTNSFAQARASAKTQVISIDPVGLFLPGHEVRAQYEWKASPISSWFIRGIYGSVSVGGLDYQGLGIAGGHKFFIIDSRALTGWAVAPVVGAYFWTTDNASSEQFISLGGEGSYKAFIGEDFSVEPFVGVAIGFLGDQISYLTTARVYGGIYLGYAW